MTTTRIQCKKLNKQAPALTRPPYPGALGQRIVENISQEAWDLWLDQQTILINENRLSMIEKSARDFLEKAMIEFLFDEPKESQ